MRLDNHWRDLEHSAPGGVGHLRKKLDIGGAVDVYLALAEPSGCRVLALAFPKDVDIAPLREVQLRGLEISKAPFPLVGDTTTISIAARSTEYNDIFAGLAEDVVGAVEAAGPNGVVEATAGRLTHWQRFLERTTPDGLSPEAQAGLFGELWFLVEHLRPAIGELPSVQAWQGPLGGLQDFQTGTWAVEVKTTRQATPASVRIANERQLQSDGLGFLGLVILALEQRPGGHPTLVDAVTSVRDAMRPSPAALALLEDLLLSSGWTDEHAPRYAGSSYSVRWWLACDVGPEFPRLTEHDLAVGVGDVSYAVAVDACRRHDIGLESLLRWISEESGG